MTSAPKLRGLELTAASATTIGQLKKTGQLDSLKSLKYEHADPGVDLSVAGKHLKRLSLAHNHLWDIEDINKHLDMVDDESEETKVEHLNLCGNQLVDVPNLQRFKQLTVLNLADNRLECLPDDQFDYTPALRVLSLNGNKLIKLPRSLVQLNELVLLDLSRNQLPTLENFPTHPIHLRHLNIGSNPFTNGSDALDIIHRCPELTYFDASHIESLWVGQISSIFRSVPHLISLNLSFTRMRYLPVSLMECAQLQQLDLSGNWLTNLTGLIFQSSKYPRSLKSLNLCGNEKLNLESVVAGGCLKHFRQLETLDVRRCLNITATCRGQLAATLPALKRLLHETSTQTSSLLESSEVINKKENMSRYNSILGEYYAVFGAAQRRQISTIYPESPDWKAIYQDPERSRTAESLEELVESFYERLNYLLEQQQQQQQQQMDLGIRPNGKIVETMIRPQESLASNSNNLFPSDIGKMPGIDVFGVDRFRPTRIATNQLGRFHSDQSYIVLNTLDNADYEIYCWIGQQSAVDRKACAAIYAMQLKRLLPDGSVRCSCRIAEGEEPADFLRLFTSADGRQFELIHGDQTQSQLSGLQTTSKRPDSNTEIVATTKQSVRLFQVLAGSSSSSADLKPLEPCRRSLRSEPTEALICVTEREIIVWLGAMVSLNVRAKTMLHANGFQTADTSKRLRLLATGTDDCYLDTLLPDTNQVTTRDEQLSEQPPVLYQVIVDGEFIDLIQVKPSPFTPLSMDLLSDQESVYILDCGSDIFVWTGHKSRRSDCESAVYIADNVVRSLRSSRPHWTTVTTIEQNRPDYWFQLQFQQSTGRHTKNNKSLYNLPNEANSSVDRISEQMFDIRHVFAPKCHYNPIEFAELLTADLQSILLFKRTGQKYSLLVPQHVEDECTVLGSDECLIIVLVYNCFDPVIYFWQGVRASSSDRLLFEFGFRRELVSLIETQTGRQPFTFIVNQFHEPVELRMAFQGHLVIETSQFADTDTKLFEVCGQTLIDSVAVEIPSGDANLNMKGKYLLKSGTSAIIYSCGDSAEQHEHDLKLLAARIFPNVSRFSITQNWRNLPATFKISPANCADKIFECSASTGKLTARLLYSPVCRYQFYPSGALIVDGTLLRGKDCSETVYRFASDLINLLKI